jgi:site-specific DNA-methyltransferase (adenine-specific)
MTKIGYLPFATIIWHKVQIGNRFAWGSWRSLSSCSFPKPVEYILIFAKESHKVQTKGTTDLKKEEFIKWSLAIWDIGPETQMKKIGHPAMFPVELLYRLMKMLSWKNATVLDVSNGAGTTGAACQQVHAFWITLHHRVTLAKIPKRKSLVGAFPTRLQRTRPKGLEPSTFGSTVRCSSQLSYGPVSKLTSRI